MPIIWLIIIFVVAGSVLGARNAIPGDVLYYLKINANENVRSLLTVTPAGDARAKLDQAIARLDEAAKLDVQNKLTAPVRTLLEARFQSAATDILSDLEELRDRGENQTAAAIESDLREALKERRAALLQLNGRFDPDNLKTLVPGYGSVEEGEISGAGAPIIQLSSPTIEATAGTE